MIFQRILYTTLKLSTGESVQVYELKPHILWAANINYDTRPKDQQHLPRELYFVLKLITVDNKPVDIAYVANMEIETYCEIQNLIAAMFEKLRL